MPSVEYTYVRTKGIAPLFDERCLALPGGAVTWQQNYLIYDVTLNFFLFNRHLIYCNACSVVGQCACLRVAIALLPRSGNARLRRTYIPSDVGGGHIVHGNTRYVRVLPCPHARVVCARDWNRGIPLVATTGACFEGRIYFIVLNGVNLKADLDSGGNSP